MILDISRVIAGKIICDYNDESTVFDSIDDISKNKKYARTKVKSISAKDNIVVLKLVDDVPIIPAIDQEELWVKNQLGENWNRAFDN